MKIRVATIFTISFSMFLFSCSEKAIITHYDSGEKYEEYQYTGDSLKHGMYKSFTKGGLLIEESNYVEGKLDGQRKIYDKNGKLEIDEIYTMDVLNGPYTVYHPTGKPKMVGQYKNNVLAGTVKGYYPSGELMEEVTFVDNIEDGPFKEYHINGELKWEGAYKNGDNEFGLLKEYNESGELIRKMMCDDRAICTTTWTIDGSHLKKNKEG